MCPDPSHFTSNLLNEVTCKQSRMGVHKHFLEFFCLALVHIVLIQANNYDYNYHSYKTKCYECHLAITSGDPTGDYKCRDPFVNDGIEIKECYGSCRKTYHKISDIESYIRKCDTNCKEEKIENVGYTKCCTGDLCNGSVPTAAGDRAQQLPLKLAIAGLVVWFIMTYQK